MRYWKNNERIFSQYSNTPTARLLQFIWSNGVMRYWKNTERIFSHYSSTPTLHYPKNTFIH